MKEEKPQHQDISSWKTKKEIATTLGITERTLERKIDKGEIRSAERPVPGRRPAIVLHPEDVERLEKSILKPIPTAVGDMSKRQLTTAPTAVENRVARTLKPSPDLAALMALMSRPPLRVTEKYLLSTAEAAEISGLSQWRLRTAARTGLIPFVKGRSYLFRPADIRLFIDSLVRGAVPDNRLKAITTTAAEDASRDGTIPVTNE
jgi:hypothetical protein